MAMKNDIEDAAMVLYAEYMDSDECVLKAKEDMEHDLIFKDSMEKLSKEAKLVISIILTMPAEMFDAGRIVHRKLIKYMKHRFHWKAYNTKQVLQEIRAVYE